MKDFLQRKWMYVIGVIVLFFVFDFALNYTLYNPAFITPIYGFFVRHGVVAVEETGGYPLVSIQQLSSGYFGGPRAAAEGIVTYVQKSGDGDYHINLSDGSHVLVCEIVPEYQLPIPAVGQKIHIWGIPRYDLEHRWGELHPVFGWNAI